MAYLELVVSPELLTCIALETQHASIKVAIHALIAP